MEAEQLEQEGARAVAASEAGQATERERIIASRWSAWQALREQLKKVRAEMKEKLEARKAELRAAIEQPLSPGDTAGAVQKLRLVERAWQDLEEAKAEKAEAIKLAKDDVADAERRLREAIESVNQMMLPLDAGDEG